MPQDASEEVREGLGEAAAVELATAERPRNVELRLDLVELYEQERTPDCAAAEAARLQCESPKHRLVLAVSLDVMRRRRDLAKLMRLIGAAEAIGNKMPARLRLAVARALETVGLADKAACHYAELIRGAHGREIAGEHVAEFVCEHPDMPELLSALLEQAETSELPPSLQYAIFRAVAEQDRHLGRKRLAELPFEAIGVAEIVFDIAVQSFRLGDWDTAARAGKHVLGSSADHEEACRLLVSAHSFAGRLEDAKEYLAELREPAVPLALGEGFPEGLEQIVDTHAEGGLCVPCAVMWPEATESETWSVVPYEFSRPPDELADHLDAHPESLTASVVGLEWDQIGPWEVLAEADLVRPHVMVQRTRNGQILHGFAAASDSGSWSWREVPMVLQSGSALQARAYRWICGEETPENIVPSAARNLWRQVQQELRTQCVDRERAKQ